MGRMTIVMSRRMLAGATWRGVASWTRLATEMLSPRRSSSSSSHSALYVSDADSRHTAPVELNLDMEKKLSSPTALVRNLRLRGLKGDVDELVKAHRRMVQLLGEKRKLEEEKGHVALLMAEIKKAKNPANDKSKDILISQGKSIKENLKKITQEWWAADEEVTLAALALPNDLHPSTPEEDIRVLKKAFTEREIGPSASHVDIAKKFNLMKFSNVGPHSFYVMGDLARLELSLTDFVSCTLADLSFSQVTCPEMFHTAIVEGCGLDATDPSQVYTLQSRVSEKEADVLQQHMDRLHLRGASLLSFAAYLARMRIEPKSLPLKLFSTGRQYRPESTLPGLFGARQTTKVQMLVGCGDETESDAAFEEMTDRLWELYQSFSLPMRLVVHPASGLQPAESRRAEVQVWAPSLQQHVQVAVVSDYSDFVSRRLMIYQSATEEIKKDAPLLRMVHGECLDTATFLAILLEYGSDRDEGYRLPELGMLPNYSQRMFLQRILDVDKR